MVCKSRKKLQKKYRDSIKNDSEKLFEEIKKVRSLNKLVINIK